MVKKKSASSKSAKHVSLSTTHVMIKRSIVSYAVLVFLFFTMAAMSWYLVDRMVVSQVNQTRLDRISSIYTSLGLGDSYRIAASNVFGDKRVYSWDKGRTFSSSVEYGHNDTVTNTFADLKKKTEAAGFSFVQSEYSGSIVRIDEYKNKDGEYIRISVVNADVQGMNVYGTPTSVSQIADTNAAPSYVTIKVNLDDNNE